jgi:hypothetical protein
MKLPVYVAIFLSILFFSSKPLDGQEANDHLFQKLLSDETSDEAFGRFMELGKKGADVREYLAVHLPEKIAAGPGDHTNVWVHEVDLVGHFRIVKAIPALIQNIDQLMPQDYVTFGEKTSLGEFPAGRALAKIGEPSVPALSSVLETGDYQKRWVASHALNMIDATAATEALKNHLPHESNAELKGYIEKVVQRKNELQRRQATPITKIAAHRKEKEADAASLPQSCSSLRLIQ